MRTANDWNSRCPGKPECLQRPSVQCTKRSQAFLTLRDEINFTPEDGTGGGGGNSGNRSPDDIFKVVAITEIMPPAEKSDNDTSDIDPMTHPNSKIEYLHGGVPTGKVISYDLYIQLEFKGSAVLEFHMFGEPIVRGTTDEPADGFYADPYTFPPDESTGTPIPGAHYGPKQPGQQGPRPPGHGDQQGPSGPPDHGGQYGPPPPGPGGQFGPPPPGHGVQSSFGNRWSCDPSILEDLKRNEIGAYGVGDRGNGPPPQGGEGGPGGPGKGQGPGGRGHGQGPPHQGPPHQGPPHQGPPHQGPPHQGPPHQGPPHQGPPHQGPPHQGPPHQGPPHQGPPHQGPPHQGPPHQGPPHQGPPHQGPPHQGPPHQGPPHQGPPQQGQGGHGYGLRRKEDHFWGISQDVGGNTVKWPSLVVDDNLKYEAIGAGQCLNPDTWVTSACCVILLTLFGMR
ncbi:unnamed protein product [Spodoptera littoralis]|uniref:Uncharacterized protein n=1 Tax=Spodoptera littoralis TaxID=7109 RepID=A0A9P0N3B0_SPOLI|nr:unnamed protein product [Spodoptera littoralis]CAH1639968.1 unnamed protein product [Spodoptera littoralis]